VSLHRNSIEEDEAELLRWARPHLGLLPAGGTRRRRQAEASHAAAVDLAVVIGPSQKDAKKKDKRDRERTQQEVLHDLAVVTEPSQQEARS
jgi:hypothetical protein